MSRLESMRRRLTAQIDGINWAAAKITDIPGDVLEMGLGNGRSYDHLRQEVTDRRIWVIDRILKCHPSCVPPEPDFLEGEAEPMMQRLIDDGHKMALAHYDFGYGIKERDVEEGARLSPLIVQLMSSGGLVLSQQPLVGLTQIVGPDTIDPERYLFYRAA
ncbi:class I SAM-dependent methyltransferase [uncultured Tateyamaria sp.]|uniref:class I SAM-dependent methyltransferase n=1 Tax=uncultured Tateyamaria sp. TaxID=455651 RepID=UPI0026367045|nr:class I SAM-dependent methyltransferase [uncultured Tateyamaria sp.]